MEDSKVFSVRIVSIDYYMTAPIPGIDISESTFHGGKVKEVPVIRIFGPTTAGQKSCLHIHRSKQLDKKERIYLKKNQQVQSYLRRQWKRILSGRVSLQDFVFAKEVRLGTYSARASSLPPAAIVATKAMKVDPQAEPRYAERIPYVVVHGEPGARLVDMVVDPLEVLAMNSPFRLNAIITSGNI